MKHLHSNTPPTSATAPLPSRTVGSFHYGIVRHTRPHTLATWRATTPQPRIARRLAALLGGHPQPDPVSGQVEVITTTNSLDILVSGPEALEVRWSSDPRKHTCDGTTQCDAQGIRPCTCPAALNERRIIARRGDGCGPRTQLRFRLGQAPKLGMFIFANGTWTFVSDASTVKAKLRRENKPAAARLRLVRATPASGHEPAVMYTRPALTLVRVRVTAGERRRQHQHA